MLKEYAVYSWSCRTGTMSRLYLDQMTPVAAIAACCGTEMFSTGLLMSAMFARLIPHLKVGAQKKTNTCTHTHTEREIDES